MPIDLDEFRDSKKSGGKPNYPPGKDAQRKEAEKVRNALAKVSEGGAPAIPFEPRCRVCTSPHRKFIDGLLAHGQHSYVWIAENVPGEEGQTIDRRSISNHAKKHLAYQDAAIRAILEEEAKQAGQDYETGVRGAITHRAVLEVGLRKAYQDLIDGVTTVEPRDMIAIITALQKMDEESETVAVNQLRAQVDAFVQAIRAETNEEQWARIFDRFRRTMAEEGMAVEGTAQQLPS